MIVTVSIIKMIFCPIENPFKTFHKSLYYSGVLHQKITHFKTCRNQRFFIYLKFKLFIFKIEIYMHSCFAEIHLFLRLTKLLKSWL